MNGKPGAKKFKLNPDSTANVFEPVPMVFDVVEVASTFPLSANSE
jgi:hypothetical protein